VTHLFNGMAPLHHREPGIVGAALDDDRLTPTVIADGIHVHPVALRLAFARRPDVAVVSDAVALGDGVVGRNGAAYLEDGTLAGTTTLLDGALGTLVHAGIAVERAVEAVTVAPASVLGLTDRGRISPGARADLVALDPTTFVPRAVWIDGRRLAIPRDPSGDR
jgi:N-acetylglucosamine-6-phosphate deacetylase